VDGLGDEGEEDEEEEDEEVDEVEGVVRLVLSLGESEEAEFDTDDDAACTGVEWSALFKLEQCNRRT
jgi:hypothetical protein